MSEHAEAMEMAQDRHRDELDTAMACVKRLLGGWRPIFLRDRAEWWKADAWGSMFDRYERMTDEERRTMQEVTR